jgi:uncharacterized protein (TIGR02145 family)
MKRFIAFLPVLFFLKVISAQAPQGISYQAVVRDAQNELVSNAPVSVRISILQGSVEGTAVFVETHQLQTNTNGLVSLVIGQGNQVVGSFEQISWPDGPYFIKTETDPGGGSNYGIVGVTELLSVPYALFAGEAASSQDAFSGDYHDLSNKPDLDQFATRDMQNDRITNLGNPLNDQDAANKIYIDALVQELLERIEHIESELGVGPPPVTDIDGNVYQTVRIGNQLWMAENLRVTHYNNGEPIPNLAGNEAWSNAKSDGFAWFDNDYQTWGEAYGALYNWYAVTHEAGLCPAGWVPAKEADWVELAQYLDEDADPTSWPESLIAGGLLKSTRTYPDDDHPRWSEPNLGASDETGFSALPGGWRGSNGLFHAIGNTGYWWVATQGGVGAWYRSMVHDNPALWRSAGTFSAGMSVRCIKP